MRLDAPWPAGAARTVRSRAPRARRPRPSRRLALAVLLAAGAVAAVVAAELQPETIAAWSRYIGATEQRIADEMAPGGGFLILDFGPDAARERRDVLAGVVRVVEMETRAPDGERMRVPKGSIHHWRGSVLIPDVSLEHVLRGLMAIAPSDLQGDVVESRVIARDGDRQHFYMRLRRRQFVTADFNTEHRVAYTRHGPDTASSRSTAIRIAELEDAGSPGEREKPVGHDRGLLWRLRTYWRFQQVDAGVIAECETVTLSRGIPRLLGWMVRPLVNRTGREVLTETLSTMAAILSAAEPFDRDDPPRVERANGP